MRKIAGPGHVGNAFVDYNPPGTPTGTYVMAAWGNDVQDELRGIEDEFSIAQAAGTNKYVLAAIKGLAIAHGKPLGELFFLHKHKDPAAFNKNSPENYFPALCLDDGDHDIAAANWPDLVPELRAIKSTYNEGITGEDSAFDVTNWAVATNVGTLTFANTTAENTMLAALAEDNLVHGNYTSWRSITLAGAIGNIPAGEYAITALNATARTVTFNVTASDGSGGVTATAEFYRHRIPGSSTTARVYERPAGVLVAANDPDGECIAGYRRRDRFQGHIPDPIAASGSVAMTLANGFAGGTSTGGVPGAPYNGLKSDGTNGTPRTGKTTDPRSLVGHLFMHGRTYLA